VLGIAKPSSLSRAIAACCELLQPLTNTKRVGVRTFRSPLDPRAGVRARLRGSSSVERHRAPRCSRMVGRGRRRFANAHAVIFRTSDSRARPDRHQFRWTGTRPELPNRLSRAAYGCVRRVETLDFSRANRSATGYRGRPPRPRYDRRSPDCPRSILPRLACHAITPLLRVPVPSSSCPSRAPVADRDLGVPERLQ
jgi:hypothetical protein